LSCPNVAPSTKKNSSFVCENIPGNKTVSDSDSDVSVFKNMHFGPICD